MFKRILFIGLFTGASLYANVLVTLKTNKGDIKLEIFSNNKKLKKTTENFVVLAGKKYYNGVIFHRVIKDFMIQSGDPTGTGMGGKSIYKAPFKDEIDVDLNFDKPGVLAMANSGPNTNGSQFFITTKPTPWLKGKHTIFGKVVGGMDVVHKIENVKVNDLNKPIKPIIIKSVKVEKLTSKKIDEIGDEKKLNKELFGTNENKTSAHNDKKISNQKKEDKKVLKKNIDQEENKYGAKSINDRPTNQKLNSRIHIIEAGKL